ncbi:MAG: hypothetical protein ABSG98_08770 [Anaerolineales bacterium]
MLDNLRERAGYEPPEDELPPEETRRPLRFHLTPAQSLLLAVFLFLDVCVLGALCLLVTQRVFLPF